MRLSSDKTRKLIISNFKSIDDCLTYFLAQVQILHPYYACAVLQEGYRSSEPLTIWDTKVRLCDDFRGQYHGVCIPPTDYGAWLEPPQHWLLPLKWKYNPNYFVGNSTRITFLGDGLAALS
ncbi:hypothetical protein DSO57_1003096 [Entomophthora muscae]|uniref:Uncharacterized protein n=1 Tax=Entomophthora muscae TaxID=34485 RepID=A0ACC2UUR5_9FUNG|nr:hypothetical protein DSO57_1003096 [Entomophthora muscae]